MDTEKKLKEWLNKMEYPGKIPRNLSKLCNPATAPLWEQIILKVKPKDEVQNIRNIIIMNRLKKENSVYTSTTTYNSKGYEKAHIKELEVWKQKIKLEKETEHLNNKINQNDNSIEELTTQNKLKYLKLQNIKLKNKEPKQRTFLLAKRNFELEQVMSNADELLLLGKNLTPIETTENQTSTEILNTLTNCAEKLENIISKTKSTKNPNLSSCIASQSCFNLETVGQGTFLTPSSHMSKKFFSARKQNTGKKNDSTNTNRNLLSASKNLLGSRSNSSFHLGTLSREENSSITSLLEVDQQSILQDAGQILYKYPRFHIWSLLGEIHEKLRIELMNAIVQENTNIQSAFLGNAGDGLEKLYAMHIEVELQIRKSKQIINKMKSQYAICEKKLFKKLPWQDSLPNKAEELKHIIELQREEVGLTAVLSYLQKELVTFRNESENTSQVLKVEEEQRQVELQLQRKFASIQSKLSDLEDLYFQITNYRKEATKFVKKLKNYTEGMEWTDGLSECRSSSELELFFKYPIEFNKRVSNSLGKKIFSRCLFSDRLPPLENVDSNSLHMLTSLITCPSSVPEYQLLQVTDMQSEINELKNMPEVCFNEECPTYTLNDLKSQEQVNIEYSVNTFTEVKQNIISKSTTASTKLKNYQQFSMEMPIKKYISSKRLFNGENYDFYDKKYFDIYKNL